MRTSTLFSKSALVFLSGLLSVSSASALLVDRDLDGNGANGPEAYYDTTLNITWLRAANQSILSWQGAVDWATGLNINGVTGWRLPSATGATTGYRVPTPVTGVISEMTSLYYDTLGNIGFLDPANTIFQPGYGFLNTGGFQTIGRPDNEPYWNDTYENDSSLAWIFDLSHGLQTVYTKTLGGRAYSMAVRDGDVLEVSEPIPEPQSLALVFIALLGMVAVRLRGKS